MHSLFQQWQSELVSLGIPLDHANLVQVDFAEVARECGIVTKGAAQVTTVSLSLNLTKHNALTRIIGQSGTSG